MFSTTIDKCWLKRLRVLQWDWSSTVWSKRNTMLNKHKWSAQVSCSELFKVLNWFKTKLWDNRDKPMYGIGVAHCILVTATFPWKWVWGLGIILSIWVFDNLLLDHVGLDHGLYLTGFSISRTLRQSNITLWIIELLTSQPKISLNSFLYPRDKVIAVLTITEADVDIHIHLQMQNFVHG